ncbi:uncharacterized protein LOC123870654 [Maniola jurtina]|uniref:uncharacterized protein LOC123870654 n=1 Tax=Maniola jurtina TaxID=191418 RepID=UPI001E68F61C|nr:uncharacterized protein LOC123870654 [Maniola jurtina]
MEMKMDQDFSTINKLPDEILLMIFDNISGHLLNISVSKVCRRWKHLISHLVLHLMDPGDEVKIKPSLRALLVTSFIPTWPDPLALISQIAATIPNLRELTISAHYVLGKTELKIVETMHNLRHLDIVTENNRLDGNTPIPCNITSLVVNDNMVPGFLRKMKTQKVIKAFHMYGRSLHYASNEMDRFLKHHSIYLTELTLRCSELEDRRYETISQCKRLTSLQLYSCVQLTFKGASHLTTLTELRRLHITGMRMVRVDSLLDFIQNLPCHIVELNLSYSWFEDKHCSALADRLPYLRYLELWRSRVSSNGLAQLIKLLTSLEDIDTDVIFNDRHIKSFIGHQSLQNIRCRWIRIDRIHTPLYIKSAPFYIKSAVEKVPAQYLRVDEEGPRAGHFYYWLQDFSIRTPPNLPLVPVGQGLFRHRIIRV